jgi:hypothetical protein
VLKLITGLFISIAVSAYCGYAQLTYWLVPICALGSCIGTLWYCEFFAELKRAASRPRTGPKAFALVALYAVPVIFLVFFVADSLVYYVVSQMSSR